MNDLRPYRLVHERDQPTYADYTVRAESFIVFSVTFIDLGLPVVAIMARAQHRGRLRMPAPSRGDHGLLHVW